MFYKVGCIAHICIYRGGTSSFISSDYFYQKNEQKQKTSKLTINHFSSVDRLNPWNYIES